MYVPTLARFTALDPMPPDGEPVLLTGDPTGTVGSPPSNPYGYARNNSVRYTDPSGLEATDSTCDIKTICESEWGEMRKKESDACKGNGYTKVTLTVTVIKTKKVVDTQYLCLKCPPLAHCEQLGESCQIIDDIQVSQDKTKETKSKKCSCKKKK